MTVQYCDRCGRQIDKYLLSISYSYKGSAVVQDAILCEECTHKFEQWIYCENIEDRLERVADRLERMVGGDDG